MSDEDYQYLRGKVDKIFTRTEQIPVIILRLDGLNNFKAKCEKDRDEFEERVKTLETEVVSDEKIEEFKKETRTTRRWFIGIFITVIIFVGTVVYQMATAKTEGSQTELQYCNCSVAKYCVCDKDICGCLECKTIAIEKEN